MSPQEAAGRPYWLTRDEDAEGVLSEQVEVWMERPARWPLSGGGWTWLGADDTGLLHRYSVCDVAYIMKECRVVPETSRECIKIG